MRAVTWQGRQDVRVEDVPDPRIEDATDVIVRITTTGLCGSDLHLYDPLTPFMTPGDVVGHEPMGIVEEVGADVRTLQRGDRVVVPFNISCGTCWTCERGLQSQCETTQNRDQGTGASLFGFSEALRAGARRPGRVPPRAVRRHPADQGARGAVRRPVRLPLRRAADRVAVRRVRRHPRRRHRDGARRRPDRRHGGPHRDAPRPPRHRGRPGAGAARACARPRRGDPRPPRRRLRRDPGPGARAHRRTRSGRRHRRCRARGARLPHRRGGDEGTGAASQAGAGSRDDQGRHRPARRPPPRDRERPARRHRLHRRRVRRRRGPHAPDADVRQADPVPHGPGERAALERRHPRAPRGGRDHLGVEDFATHRLPLEDAPQAYASFRDKADGMVKVLFQP